MYQHLSIFYFSYIFLIFNGINFFTTRAREGWVLLVETDCMIPGVTVMTSLTILQVRCHHMVSTHTTSHIAITLSPRSRYFHQHPGVANLLLNPGENLLLRPVKFLPEMWEPLVSVPLGRSAHEHSQWQSCLLYKYRWPGWPGSLYWYYILMYFLCCIVFSPNSK